jgi:hypothetical protein
VAEESSRSKTPGQVRKPVRKKKKLSPAQEYKPVPNPIPPQRRSRGPAAQYDWTTIRNEYVEGYLKDQPKDEFDRIFPTYEQLHKRHGASLSAIRARGSKERWKNLKDQYAVELVQARQRKRANKLANAAVQFDDNALKVGELGITLVMSRLAEVAREMQARQAMREAAMQDLAQGKLVDKMSLRSAVYHSEMQTLANAAEKFQQIGMRSLGTSADSNTNIMMNVQGDANVGNSVKVSQELIRDDKERASAVVSGFVEAGVLPRDFILAISAKDEKDTQDIMDAEIVEDAKEVSPEPPEPVESVPDTDDEEYELDPEIAGLIQSLPGVNVSDLDPRMKPVRTEEGPAQYGGSDYDLDPYDSVRDVDRDPED